MGRQSKGNTLELAKRLGMKTVAEGVEHEEEAEFLQKAGCERLQGYLYGKPVPSEEFAGILQDGSFKISEKTL